MSKTLCSTCGRRVYVRRGQPVSHDVEGRHLPSGRAGEADTKKMGPRHLARLSRQAREVRVPCEVAR